VTVKVLDSLCDYKATVRSLVVCATRDDSVAIAAPYFASS
jgi:hypothetical protein